MDDCEQTIDKVLWIWMTVNRQLLHGNLISFKYHKYLQSVIFTKNGSTLECPIFRVKLYFVGIKSRKRNHRKN